MYCIHMYSTFHGHNIEGALPSPHTPPPPNKILGVGGGAAAPLAPPVPTPLKHRL